MFIPRGIEHFEPRHFRLAERCGFGGQPHQSFDQVMAGIGIERRLDPGKAGLGGERLGCLIHFGGGKRFEQRDIGPGFAVLVVEQFALDPSTGCEIGVAPDQPGARIAATHRSRQDHAANAVGGRRVIGRGDLLEDARLDFLIRGRAKGLGDVQRDRTGGQRLEHHRGKGRKSQPAFDEAHGQTEASGDLLYGRAIVDKARKRLRFVGRVHRQAMEVFCKAGFGCHRIGSIEHQAGDLVVAGQYFVIDKGKHGTAATLTRFDFKPAFGRDANDKVLQETVRGNAGLEFGISLRITMPANIARRGNELVEGN